MNWDYYKLFAEGNYIGVKNKRLNKVYYHLIHEENPFTGYQNGGLKSGEWIVWRIIQLNENGEITDVLFDRERDFPEPMPELKTGMFVHVIDEDNSFDDYGVVVNSGIVYCKGGWSDMREEIPYIVAVWDDNVRGFGNCSVHAPIWKK